MDPGSAAAVAPTVSLARGPSAPAGYRYSIRLDHFATGSSISVTCYDSASPGGFYTFSLGTDASGHAFTQGYCYSGDGLDHWVTAGGVQSNHVNWGASSGGGGGTGGGGTTGGSGDCTPPTGVATSGSYEFDNMARQPFTIANRVRDTRLVAEAQGGILWKTRSPRSVSYRMVQHYLGATGSDFSVNLNNLMINQPPLRSSFHHYLRRNAATAYSTLSKTDPAGCASLSISSGWIGYIVTDRGDWYYAMRSFSYQVAGTMWIGSAGSGGNRPVVVVYRAVVADTYNFNPDDPKFGKFELLAKDGWAADFRVQGGTLTFSSRTTTAKFNAQSLTVPLP